jgi:hypothetical protein
MDCRLIRKSGSRRGEYLEIGFAILTFEWSASILRPIEIREEPDRIEGIDWIGEVQINKEIGC